MAEENTQLVDLSSMGLEASKYADDKGFMEVAQGSGFLPRLQLYGGNSDAAKEGKIGMGHYGVVRSKDQIDDCGKEVAVLVLGWRPKAMEIDGDNITTVYDKDSPDFKRIATKSEEPNSGCMFGPEFLVWVPSCETFATFFMSSKTARREAPNVKAQMGKAATLKAVLISTKKYKWHGPQCTICSTAFAIPDELEMREQIIKFNNPPVSETEAAPVDAATRAR